MSELHDAHVIAWINTRDVFRCYPRTMQQAFKQSEGYRVPVAGPFGREGARMFRSRSLPETPRGAVSGTMARLQEALLTRQPTRREILLDRIGWAIGVPLFVLLLWWLARAPEHLLRAVS